MNHQPFETWILEPQELDAQKLSELERHLAGCEACRRLQAGWKETSVELRSVRSVNPRAGFTQRWQASLVERKRRDQRRQAWVFFLSCSGAAALILVGFAVYLLSSTSPVEWIQAGVRALSTSVGLVGAFRDFTTTWLQVTPPLVNVALWISVALTFCTITFIWVFALWRTSLGGVFSR